MEEKLKEMLAVARQLASAYPKAASLTTDLVLRMLEICQSGGLIEEAGCRHQYQEWIRFLGTSGIGEPITRSAETRVVIEVARIVDDDDPIS